jgi:hypothetical protein
VFSPLGCGDDSESESQRRIVMQNCEYNTNQFIMDRLNENRIVMIDDHKHIMYVYKRTIADFLNYWVDEIEQGNETVPRKLFLVLEMDSLAVNRIVTSYDRDDNRGYLEEEPLSCFQWTTGHIQFRYHELKSVSQRIDEYNASHDGNDSIWFAIVGPEKPIDTENWSFAKRANHFVYERDEYSSSQIIELLERHPDYRALAFYGGAHLIRSRCLKQTDVVSDSGYYMAHYLAGRFEDDGGIYRIYQGLSRTPDIRRYELTTSPGETYAIDNQYLGIDSGSSHLAEIHSLNTFDGSIIHFDAPVNGTRLGSVWSRNLLDHIVEHMACFENPDNDLAKTYLRIGERYLRIFSAERYEDDLEFGWTTQYAAQDWNQRWYATATIDVVGDIESLAIWNRLLDRMSSAQGRHVNWYEYILAGSLGIPPRFDTLASTDERVESYRIYLGINRDDIVVRNLVHLLWIGTEEEIEKANTVLRRVTGEDFDVARDWSRWWRRTQGNSVAD